MKNRKRHYSEEFKQDVVNYYYSSDAEKEIAKLKKELRDKEDALDTLKKAIGNLSTAGVLRAIEKAKANRKIDSPLIIHSDRGVQYISKAYIEATSASSSIRSYSRKGNPWDNAVIESFHTLIKREWLNRFIIQHLSHAHELIFEYIETFYNTKRIHSHCIMKSLYDYEKEYVI